MLNEEQLEEARQELLRRDRERSRHYQEEYARKQREAEDRFWTGMKAKYPGISQDTMYDIYTEVRDFFE